MILKLFQFFIFLTDSNIIIRAPYNVIERFLNVIQSWIDEWFLTRKYQING